MLSHLACVPEHTSRSCSAHTRFGSSNTSCRRLKAESSPKLTVRFILLMFKRVQCFDPQLNGQRFRICDLAAPARRVDRCRTSRGFDFANSLRFAMEAPEVPSPFHKTPSMLQPWGAHVPHSASLLLPFEPGDLGRKMKPESSNCSTEIWFQKHRNVCT